MSAVVDNYNLQREIAVYYRQHSLHDTQVKFHVGVESIRNSFVVEYGMSKKQYCYQKRQVKRSNYYQIVADYYLRHSLAETQEKFQIAQRSLITHYFKRAYGVSRREYLATPG